MNGFYAPAAVAKLLSIRPDTFKKQSAAGMYRHLIGEPHRTPGGHRRYSEHQVETLLAWAGGEDVRLRVISLGGGVQSTAMVLMAREGLFNPAPDCAIFLDLGWELPATYANIWRLAELSRMPLYIEPAGNIREDLLAGAADRSRKVYSPPVFTVGPEGQRAQIGRDCTNHYKIQGIAHVIRRLLGVPEGRHCRWRVEMWLGITTDEAHRLNNNSPYGWIQNRFPLVELGMSRTDCEKWLLGHGYEVPPKSACIGCPFKPNRDWAAMKRDDPDAFAQAVEVDEAIRGGFNSLSGPFYLHQKRQPLVQIQFDASDRGGWGAECSGHCAT